MTRGMEMKSGAEILELSQTDPWLRYSHIFTAGPRSSGPVLAYDHRLIFVLGGYGTVFVDGIGYPAKKNSLLIWQPGVSYYFVPDEEDPLEILAFNFDFTRKYSALDQPIPPENESLFNPSRITGRYFVKGIYSDPVLSCVIPYVLGDLLVSINEEFNTKKNYYKQRIRGSFILFLSDLAAYLLSGAKTDNMDKGLDVDDVLKFIRKNYKEDLTNTYIGKQFSFHPNYIGRLVLKSTGVPLHRYVMQVRISEALNLLQTTDMAITEIAKETGFSGINYFSRCFKTITGNTPRFYRSGKHEI